MPYTADKRLYLDADGNVVDEGDPRAATLLVGEGGQLSDEDAKKYGLTSKAKAEPVEEKAVNEPRPNKAKAPAENKAA
jgi:hypothetical protein